MKKLIKTEILYKYDYLLEDVNTSELKGNKIKYTEYNKQGDIQKEINYDQSGDFINMYENKYDKKGYIIEEIYYESENEITERQTFERDEKEIIQKVIKYYLDGSKDTIFYKYDSDNNLTEKYLVNSDNEVESKKIYKYYKGKIISKEEYDEKNNLVSKTENKYDASDNIIEIISWDKDDGEIKVINKYNKKGIRTKSFEYNDDNELVGKTEYTADEQSKITQLTEETQYGKNIINFSYDDRGNVVLQEEYNNNNILISKIERKYDNYGNVTNSIVFIDGQGRGISQNYIMNYEYDFFED